MAQTSKEDKSRNCATPARLSLSGGSTANVDETRYIYRSWPCTHWALKVTVTKQSLWNVHKEKATQKYNTSHGTYLLYCSRSTWSLCALFSIDIGIVCKDDVAICSTGPDIQTNISRLAAANSNTEVAGWRKDEWT